TNWTTCRTPTGPSPTGTRSPASWPRSGNAGTPTASGSGSRRRPESPRPSSCPAGLWRRLPSRLRSHGCGSRTSRSTGRWSGRRRSSSPGSSRAIPAFSPTGRRGYEAEHHLAGQGCDTSGRRRGDRRREPTRPQPGRWREVTRPRPGRWRGHPGGGGVRPLDGIRVLELGQVIAGPYASLLLADLGAEVIKVERPGTGDSARSPDVTGVAGFSGAFATFNRNKRSVTLDLTDP